MDWRKHQQKTRRSLHYLAYGSLFVVVACSALGLTVKSSRHAYIGVYVNHQEKSSFFPVYMSPHEFPYVPMKASFFNWLGLHLQCDSSKTHCQLTIPNHQDRYWINFTKREFGDTEKKTVGELAYRDIIRDHQQIWIRYDVLGRWLPVNTNWSLEEYALYLSPDYITPAELAQQRQIAFQENQRQLKSQYQINHMKAITPKKQLNLQLRYRFNWFRPFARDQNLNSQFDGNADIFGGTLFGTGTVQTNSQDGLSATPIYWNYTFRKPGFFDILQFGDTYYNGSLLFPAFNLKNSLNFRKINMLNAKEGFVYQGHTSPLTEVDVYRNGILIKVIHTKADGAYEVDDPNALPNDVVTFRFYYRDGTISKKTVRVADNYDSLLEKKQWNIQTQYGEIDNGVGSTGYGRFGHLGLDYGFTPHLTGGLSGYFFTGEYNKGALGADMDWQALNTINTQAEALSYNGDTDYSLRGNYTGINHNQLQARVQHISSDSPINALEPPSIFDTLPFADVFSNNGIRYWQLKDTVSLTNWQVTPQYQDSNAGNLLGVSAIGNLTDKWSTTLAAGLAYPKQSRQDGYLQTIFFYSINDKNLLQLKRDWYENESETALMYRYQSLAMKGWDINLGVAQPDKGKFQFEAQAQWRFAKFASVSLFSNTSSVSVELAYFGILAMQPGPGVTDYDDFATGTVSGRVEAPSLQDKHKKIPVQHALIEIGGQRQYTDKNGRYKIIGLPTNTRIQYQLAASSLDASLVPDKKVVVMEFRPGTYIKYNPKLDWSAGVDGTLYHQHEPIPAGTLINLVKKPGGKPIQSAHVEQNGFFILNKILPGHYYLSVPNHPSIKPKSLVVKENSEWIPNIKIQWPAHAHTKT